MKSTTRVGFALVLAGAGLVSLSASAEEIPQGYTPEQEARIVQHNSLMTQALRQAWQEAGRKGI
ncbi:MAG: hypothetical protein IT285_12295, partial [Bdellovibrionales bacterium]|nr:hypothetical protein [Bdellovibrionales bacterium]